MSKLECNNCGSFPERADLLTDEHKAGDQCPCCYLDDYDCDGTLVYKRLRDNPDYINIRAFSRLFGRQNQYFSRLLNTRYDFCISEGLRVEWQSPGDYHQVYIHKDDAEELVRRANEHYAANAWGEYEPKVWDPQKVSH